MASFGGGQAFPGGYPGEVFAVTWSPEAGRRGADQR